jgi:hypothetical protein
VVSADCGCLLNITGRALPNKMNWLASSGPTLPGEHLASFLWNRTNPTSKTTSGSNSMSAREQHSGPTAGHVVQTAPDLPDVWAGMTPTQGTRAWRSVQLGCALRLKPFTLKFMM